MSTAQGYLALASDINSIFNRLEALRVEHYSGAGQTTAGQNALSTAFNTNPSVKEESITEPYSLMKSYLNVLRNSVFLTSITAAQVDAITVPAAGTLIKMTNIPIAENLITTIEELPSSYTTNFSSFRGSNFGFNGSNFSFGFDGSNFSFSQNSSRFGFSFGFNSSQHSGYGTSSWGARF